MVENVSQPAAVESLEVETKFDVSNDFDLPDLASVRDVHQCVVGPTHHLDATYFDTDDLKLQAHKITLRRRRGGKDAGWHLKMPATTTGRREIRVPADDDAPGEAHDIPAELLVRVQAIIRQSPLRPVATLKTSRSTWYLQDEQGVALAEVADDRVVVSRHYETPTPEHTWREIEVELLQGGLKTLKSAGKILRRHGASLSSSGSKLSTALVDYPGPRHCASCPEYSLPAAGDVIMAYLTSQVHNLISLDPAVRVNEYDSIHQLRVTARKIRSALASFRGLFDRQLTDPLRDELKWLAGAWSTARDLEVVHASLVDLIDRHEATTPDPTVSFDAIRRDLDSSLTRRFDEAFADGMTAIDSPRYFALLDSLDNLVQCPPLTNVATKPADKALLAMIAKDWRKLQALHDRAVTVDGVHDLRKGAKRSRYAADALKQHYGKPAKQWAKLSKAITENLGDHQDSVVMRATIQQLAAAAHERGENTFAYGYLYSLVEVTEEEANAQHPQQWSELSSAAQWFGR